MRATKTIGFIALLSLFSFFVNASNSSFSWNNQSLLLPFPKSWLSKKKKDTARDPLVFLDVDLPGPRIVANLYETSYSLSPTDLSVFQAKFLKSKRNWLKKNKGSLDKDIVFDFTNKFNTLRYEMHFTAALGSFVELGTFSVCPKLGKMGLKVMIPKERLERAKKLEIISYLKEATVCLPEK